MIIITGAGGFIGSVIVGYLNSKGITDIIAIDSLPNEKQFLNLVDKKFLKLFKETEIPSDFSTVSVVVHFGAISNTLEKDWGKIYESNIESTRKWNKLCIKNNVPMIFASSAAVYGNGKGPLNQYAFSKSIVEKELESSCVLRLFNVYGPNEYHKERMASTIYHWYREFSENQTIKIFENSDKFYRDFIYVEDIAKIVYYFIENFSPGIYDVGTGNSISFRDLADIFIESVDRCKIEYKSMPKDLIKQYQTYTGSDIGDLRNVGFQTENLIDPRKGVKKYLTYLSDNRYY